MPVSCPPEIKALMTNVIEWEAFKGFDGHAEPTYGPVIELLCWQEAHGTTAGGVVVYRRADGTVVEPLWDLYFSGDDKYALTIQVYDRFTMKGVAEDENQKIQALRINTLYGPNFDNRNPWIIQVTA